MSTSNDVPGVSEDPKVRLALRQFIGRNASLRTQLALLPRIARSEATVLVAGETGTGKELAARAVHYLSPRSGGAFVAINCGALPADLIENELFGHLAGAYTGAMRDSQGLVGEANGGTLFLDEVDSLPAISQVKLLRFLQEKEYRPVGGRKALRADVRVVAATSADLRGEVRDGRFRSDLYYRLNVMRLRLPALRDRRDDIADLAQYFLRKYAEQGSRPVLELTVAARLKLESYPWPGNVRELENVIHRAAVLADGSSLRTVDIVLDGDAEAAQPADFRSLKHQAIVEFERRYVADLLHTYQGNVTHAAKAAGKHRRAFWELMRKHGLTSRGRDSSAATSER